MFTTKHGETHKHRLRPAYKKDGRERWILLRVCTVQGCTFREAYDLTHNDPRGNNYEPQI